MLIKLNNLIEGQVIKRPSKYIMTPYVADILYKDKQVLGHTASLGCCGLADVNAFVLMSINPETNKKVKTKNKANMKCTHTVYLSVLKEKDNEQIIGIHPKLAETLTEAALISNMLTKLQNIKRYRRETTIYIKDKIDSRFDFTGVDENGIPFIMEVKNVPLADYEDITAKDRVKMDFSNRDFNSKVAYFPDGYRKKTSDPVSPRALKHIRELTLIKKEIQNHTFIPGNVLPKDSPDILPKIRCIMCYVIQRTDVNSFQPSIIDPEYREAFKEAVETGVEIITMVVSWNKNGEATFIRDDLPINNLL